MKDDWKLWPQEREQSWRNWSTHKWSGWPGAVCLNCGIDDPAEQALADGHYENYEIVGEDTLKDEVLVTHFKCNPCPVGKPTV